MTSRKPLGRYRRIVIKIGSALLVDRKAGLKKSWLDAMCADISGLKAKGIDVLVVSSGAIALGRSVLDLPSGALKLEESQAAAAVGQIALARAWSESLSRDEIVAGQILLTLGDTEERRRYLNARATINQLLKIGAVPIINENDTVATSEIRYGDNDRLAARVATMTGADLLILLSDIDGLYTAPPHLDPNATFLETIAEITPEIEAMAECGLRVFARRHAHQDRCRQDCHRIRLRHDHRLRQGRQSSIGNRKRRAFLVVRAIGHTRDRPQDLDCRAAAAGRRTACR